MNKVQIIKNHKVIHGDVTDIRNIQSLMKDEKADIFYSDPPWGNGNLKYWQTINNKMTGAECLPVDLNNFLKQIFYIASTYSKGIVFIEYGIRWREKIKAMGIDAGLIHIEVIPLKYRSGSKLLPLDLHVFMKGNEIKLPTGYVNSVTDTHGYETLKKAILPFAGKGKVILDPCCGMGYTAQVAVDSEMNFRGNELNFKRLEKTINRLKK